MTADRTSVVTESWRSWAPSFVLLSAIWGSSFALIKISVEAGVGPTLVAFWRCFFGALALLLICAVKRLALPRSLRVWAHAVVVALLLNAAPFALLAYGEQYTTSVVAGIFNAATPLTTLLFVLALVPQEHVTVIRIAGLALGFLGVLTILEIWQKPTGGATIGMLACLGATVCYGAGFAYTRRFFSHRGGSVVSLSATQIVCATALLAVVFPFTDGAPTWPGLGPAVALVGLGAVGTGIAYILNLRVIREAGPSTASTVTYVAPLWSTTIGAVFLAEPVGWTTIVGGTLILTGIVVSRRLPRRGDNSNPFAIRASPGQSHES